jgi:hypothetical protein
MVLPHRSGNETAPSKTWVSVEVPTKDFKKKAQASKWIIRLIDYGCKSKNAARLSQSFVRFFQPLRNFFMSGLLATSAA